MDEGRVPESELAQSAGTLSEIIRLESSPEPKVLRDIISRLTENLKDRRYDSLRRALIVWINRVVLKNLVPEEEFPELNELQEIDNMLAERVKQWTEKWMQQGMQKGEGKLLIRLIQKRFGEAPQWVKDKITQATEAQLEHWAENIFDAATVEDVFSD